MSRLNRFINTLSRHSIKTHSTVINIIIISATTLLSICFFYLMTRPIMISIPTTQIDAHHLQLNARWRQHVSTELPVQLKGKTHHRIDRSIQRITSNTSGVILQLDHALPSEKVWRIIIDEKPVYTLIFKKQEVPLENRLATH